MRKLLTADFRRILRKRSFWIVMVLTFLATVIGTMDGIDGAPVKSLKFTDAVMSIVGTMELLFGLFVLLSVYGDEFRAMTLISVIGRGISRWKFILAKFLDTVFLLGQMFLLCGLFVMLMRRVLAVDLSPEETRAILGTFAATFFTTLAGVMIASLFFFLTSSTAFGVFVYLTLSVIIPIVLTFGSMLPQVAKLHPDRWYFYGFGTRAAADFVFGSVGGGILTLALGTVLYIGSALALTWVIFRNKELDF